MLRVEQKHNSKQDKWNDDMNNNYSNISKKNRQARNYYLQTKNKNKKKKQKKTVL